MTCDEARSLAPEAALDVLDGATRAEVLEHVGTCLGCRRELRELAAAADAILELAPPSEPPAGFEGRVLARLAAEGAVLEPRARRRPWRTAAAAAAVAALAGLGGGLALGGEGSTTDLTAMRLVSSRGEAVGQVMVSDGPDRMVCVLDGAEAGTPYRVAVVVDGTEVDAGTFRSEGPGTAWAVDLPVDGADVDRVVLRGSGGWWAAADLD